MYRVYQPNFPIANSNFITVNGEIWLIDPVYYIHFFISAAIKISGGVNIDGDTTWVNSAEYTTTTSTYVNTVVVKGMNIN